MKQRRVGVAHVAAGVAGEDAAGTVPGDQV